jgi:hypothetical protein
MSLEGRIAERKVSDGKIVERNMEGVTPREGNGWVRGRPLKYDPLPRLRVGESAELRTPPRREGSKAHLVRYYQAAKELGFRVSIVTIDGNTVRVTRVPQDAPPLAKRLRIPREEVVRLYREGRLTNQEIGERAGISPAWVRAIAREAGEPVNEERRSPKIEKRKLEELYVRRGFSSNAIAKELGWDPGTVRRELRSHGVELRDDRRDPRYRAVLSLKVGESIKLPRLEPRPGSAEVTSRAYRDAGRTAGIKVSVQKIDEETVRVTRTS